MGPTRMMAKLLRAGLPLSRAVNLNDRRRILAAADGLNRVAASIGQELVGKRSTNLIRANARMADDSYGYLLECCEGITRNYRAMAQSVASDESRFRDATSRMLHYLALASQFSENSGVSPRALVEVEIGEPFGPDPFDHLDLDAAVIDRRGLEVALELHVVAEPCIDVKDRACVEECPVDCIYEGDRMLYINPAECIECGLCAPVCPVEAIFPVSALPSEYARFAGINAEYFDLPIVSRLGTGGALAVGPSGVDHPHIDPSWSGTVSQGPRPVRKPANRRDRVGSGDTGEPSPPAPDPDAPSTDRIDVRVVPFSNLRQAARRLSSRSSIVTVDDLVASLVTYFEVSEEDPEAVELLRRAAQSVMPNRSRAGSGGTSTSGGCLISTLLILTGAAGLLTLGLGAALAEPILR